MKLLIITACTGQKTVQHDNALTLEDFLKGDPHISTREKELNDYLIPAEDLYSGQQHVRLMQGIKQLRSKDEHEIDLWILSAGYGLIPSDRKIAPYECTFQGMKSKTLIELAQSRNIPQDIHKTLSKEYDFGLILLGDSYLKSCFLENNVQIGGPTLIFCGKQAAKKIPIIKNLKVVVISNPEAKRFSCGLVGLKGELALRMFSANNIKESIFAKLIEPDVNVLDILEKVNTNKVKKKTTNKKKQTKQSKLNSKKTSSQSNPNADRVIEISQSWLDKPHRKKLRYFIPEWDDLVDPDYDFIGDIHSGGTGDWSNEVYAHQMYPEPNYDGILVSRAVAEKSKKKARRINAMGVHRYIRVPRSFPVMGDCGAFDYINEEVPPYSTENVLDYYTRLDFDFGVSVDHLIVKASEQQKKFRYELTIHNAEEFINEHKKRQLKWEPIGAVQGWDPKSYAAAAKKNLAMGYKRLGIGGLVRSTTKEILTYLEEIQKVVPKNIDIHLFGLGRLNAIRNFIKYGVTSIDNASALRRAWLGEKDNYWTMTGEYYGGFRVPQSDKSFRAKRLIVEGKTTESKIKNIEQRCLHTIRSFDKGNASIEDVLNELDEYDNLLKPDRKSMREVYRRTLEAEPWKTCPCNICKNDGVEVIIFRGNNRNRRRGFHNTFVFYNLLQQVVAGENITIKGKKIYNDQN